MSLSEQFSQSCAYTGGGVVVGALFFLALLSVIGTPRSGCSKNPNPPPRGRPPVTRNKP